MWKRHRESASDLGQNLGGMKGFLCISAYKKAPTFGVNNNYSHHLKILGLKNIEKLLPPFKILVKKIQLPPCMEWARLYDTISRILGKSNLHVHSGQNWENEVVFQLYILSMFSVVWSSGFLAGLYWYLPSNFFFYVNENNSHNPRDSGHFLIQLFIKLIAP